MKRIRCPKCDQTILFDETQYEAGRILVFECAECHKQFKIRLPRSKNNQDLPKNLPVGYLTILENAFQFKQVLPIILGENIIGRSVKGTKANLAFRTVDPSIDTTHCIITAEKEKDGRTLFLLQDAPSNTGTFLQNQLLQPREQAIIKEGDIINIGAATMILKLTDE
ncbi:FHA domain-containing protein [Alloprevotella tannerae]|mgnify:FL=1|jgi:FHA domain protein|uniref:FHA domain-containing protein n=2 Tax=Alloprevotella tannerae TaxID=76122 RepID=UPI001EDA7BBB|nr:FHA domain-containing protein [Alloprevotella tannerae]MCG2646106.1 FHA domain-containing protein [Alloprevotella tannerae]